MRPLVKNAPVKTQKIAAKRKFRPLGSAWLPLVASIAALPLLISGAHAANGTWNGAAGTWNTSNTNWTGVTDPAWDLANGVNNNAIFGSSAGNVTVSGTVFANSLEFNTSSRTLSGGTITLGDNSTGAFSPFVTTASGITATISSGLAGNDGFTKIGAGTLVINTSAANTITGTIAVNEGTLRLDCATGNTNKVAPTSILALGGGTFEFKASTSVVTFVQEFDKLTINSGSSTISSDRNANGTKGIRFDNTTSTNITRNGIGGTVNFISLNGGLFQTNSQTLTNGIVGGYATFGGNSWAVATTGFGNMSALATFTTNSMSANTQNVDVTNAGFTATGDANSIRFSSAAGSTLTLAAGATKLTTGGILVQSTSGNNLITGGTSLAGAQGADLIVHQQNAASTLTIATKITDNTTATGLTKSGAGTLLLSNASNDYTGDTFVNAGTLSLADNAGLKFVIGASGTNNAIKGIGTLTLDGDFTFDLTNAATTVGSTWQIVSNSTLTEAFTSNFSAVGFTNNNDVWSTVNNGATYSFSEATGTLTVVPEPGAFAAMLGGMGMLLGLRRRRS